MPGEIEEIINRERFWQEFYKKTAKEEIPFKVSFELTYCCNLQCCHCFIAPEPDKQELTTREVFLILDQLAEAGCLELNLTGGEIFTRKDIFEILNKAKSLGFVIALLTNGTLITPEIARKIKELRPIYLEISLYGITEKTYEAVTQTPGSFGRCLSGIRLLKERNVSICLKMVVMKLNIGEFIQVKSFADELGVRFRYSPYVHPRIDGSKVPISFRLSPEEWIELEMKESSSLFEEEKKSPESSSKERRFFYCDAGRNSLAITPYGEVKLCLTYPFPRYELRKQSLSSAWKNLVNFVKSKQPGKNHECYNCELFKFCNSCPVDGWLEQRDCSACVPYLKRVAEVRQQRMVKING